MIGRLVLIGLTILLALSQYQLWVGTGSISELQRLTDELEKQETENLLKLIEAILSNRQEVST